MSELPEFALYEGEGRTLGQRGKKLPNFKPLASLHDPAKYVADEGLRNAVNIALALGQPLLVSGEPGTGKTELADSIAHELELGEPLVFHTTTTATAKDLFYRYDALGHFHESQFNFRGASIDSFISYEALGLAILLTMPRDQANRYLPEDLRDRGPRRSVVLIDEIDKAPRDLPNDVLNEIEHLTFSVKETGKIFKAEQQYRPIVILTSNLEKNLPDAFLRRCVYYNVSFPNSDRLREIAIGRLNLCSDSDSDRGMAESAIQYFESIRKLTLKKRPATAEFLAWVRVLRQQNLSLNLKQFNKSQQQGFLASCDVLGKTEDDRKTITKYFEAIISGNNTSG